MVAELVQRAQKGDAEAYTDLVRRFQDAVYATAYPTGLDVPPPLCWGWFLSPLS